MEEILASIEKNVLFKGIDNADMTRMLDCLSPRMVQFKKDTFVFRAKDEVSLVYIMLSGSAHIIEEDFWGNQSLIETMHAPVLFGEAYALSGTEKHLVNVVAAEDCAVLLIDPCRLFTPCECGCFSHITLLQNTSHILAMKVVRLTQKLIHIGQRTTRKKLMSFFSMCAMQEKQNKFTISYSRQQLADFLYVERSALSHELSKMRDEGLIHYHKNAFELLKHE